MIQIDAFKIYEMFAKKGVYLDNERLVFDRIKNLVFPGVRRDVCAVIATKKAEIRYDAIFLVYRAKNEHGRSIWDKNYEGHYYHLIESTGKERNKRGEVHLTDKIHIESVKHTPARSIASLDGYIEVEYAGRGKTGLWHERYSVLVDELQLIGNYKQKMIVIDNIISRIVRSTKF